MISNWGLGAGAATLAAIFNATVGIISVNLFNFGLTPEAVAFLKCLIALCILLTFVFLFKKESFILKIKTKGLKISICSLFGFFILYTFETKAYESLNVAVVVFILFGSSTIVTFILDSILDRRFLTLREILSISLSLIGLGFIFSYELSYQSINGVINAIISGLGYGIFLVLSKRMRIGSDIVTLTSLMLFGTIYLFIYYIFNDGSILNYSLNNVIAPLILLAILPTIGGFYSTIKALELIKSQSVQLIELTEPVFAMIFSFLFLGQLTTPMQMLGGSVIILSILIHELDVKYISNKLSILSNDK